jgi:hypothetical protein
MRNSLKITALALGVAGTTLTASLPAAAAPVASNTALVKATAPDATTDVRYRYYGGYYRRNWAGPVIAGAALGLIGAGIAASTWPGYYYGGPYGYGYGAPYAYRYSTPYAYSYGYGPSYGWGPYQPRERWW